MSRILVIEDDDGIRANILDLLEAEGFEGMGAPDGEQGVTLAMKHLPDLVICDIAMSGIDGFGVFELLSERPATAVIPFIFLSARSERADIRRGMALGADDYLTKPFTRTELLDSLHARLRRRRTRGDTLPPSTAPSLPSPAAAPSSGPDAREERVTVADPAMTVLFEQVERVSRGPISVLILGETGVGKEVVAEEIHRRSGRRGRFVPLNCAALTESLLESELFGYEKGAFTGAVRSQEGLFESAEGGTLFLDEVGELPQSTQVKLLRVLEDRKVMRVGGRSARAIDVRFVSATNRDLELEAERGGFRQDLFFRLNGISFSVPPLRERRADIEVLAMRFITMHCRAVQRADAPVLSGEALQVLLGYRWPGNIRELRNVIERAVLLCDGPALLPNHLPEKLITKARSVAAEGEIDPRARLALELEQLERERVIEALQRCGGNQTQAAELLGISRRTLLTRLEQYELPRPRKRS